MDFIVIDEIEKITIFNCYECGKENEMILQNDDLSQLLKIDCDCKVVSKKMEN